MNLCDIREMRHLFYEIKSFASINGDQYCSILSVYILRIATNIDNACDENKMEKKRDETQRSLDPSSFD